MIRSTRQFLIDTDIGTDDAVAIVMAMQNKDIDIVGITTVGGNIGLDNVVQNALYLIELAENSIPVYVGEAKPLVRKAQDASFIHGVDGLGDTGINLSGRVPNDLDAINAIVQHAIEQQGDLEIITLGPLTNLAKVLQSNPEIDKLIKHCYIMGGLYELPGNITPLAEYNIWADPEAAEIVLRSDLDITTIGWDVALNDGVLSIDELEQLKNIDTPLSHFCADIQHVRLAGMKERNEKVECRLADAIAMTAAIDETAILDHEYVWITVHDGIDEEEKRGVFEFSGIDKESRLRPIKIVKKVNNKIFKDLIFQAVGG